MEIDFYNHCDRMHFALSSTPEKSLQKVGHRKFTTIFFNINKGIFKFGKIFIIPTIALFGRKYDWNKQVRIILYWMNIEIGLEYLWYK